MRGRRAVRCGAAKSSTAFASTTRPLRVPNGDILVRPCLLPSPSFLGVLTQPTTCIFYLCTFPACLCLAQGSRFTIPLLPVYSEGSALNASRWDKKGFDRYLPE